MKDSYSKKFLMTKKSFFIHLALIRQRHKFNSKENPSEITYLLKINFILQIPLFLFQKCEFRLSELKQEL